MARPFLKWAGGKTKLVEDIVTHMRSKPLGIRWTVRQDLGDKRYIEPFVGGAGAYLGLWRHGMIDAEKTILADINEVLIVTLSAIADEGTKEDVIRVLSGMETEFENDPAGYYYERRGYLNKSIIPSPGKDRVETAAHMIFINKTCFNGLWRVNSRGEMNTPLGRSPSGKTQILDKGGLMEFGSAVNGAELLHQGWRETMKSAGEGDLVYVDPPYWPTQGEYVFRDYSKDGFLDSEQIEVAKLCAEAAARGARVIISNNYSESIRKEYWRAAREAGARISRSRKGGRFQRRVRLKRTMRTVVGGEREQVEEILVFMAPKN